MSDTPQAGWYPDPNDATQQRYWDGTTWTEHTAAGAAQAAAPAAPSFATGISSGGGTGGTAPDPWLWQSIVATIICCLPFGIAGIVNAAKANSLIAAGDMAGATAAAEKAKKWTIISAVVGVVAVVLYIGFFVAVIAGSGFEQY